MTHLEWALWYGVKLGWKVFPVFEVTDDGCSCSRGKDCTAPGKHPRTRRGLLDASNDPKQIEAWWKAHPHAGIGTLVGSSNMLVVDVDRRGGGLETAKKLHEKFGFPKTAQAKTGGGGYHLFFSVDEPTPNKTGAWQGIDIKSNNGFVVLPPTVHSSGNRYMWREGHDPISKPIVPAPQFVLDLFKKELDTVKKSKVSSVKSAKYHGPKPRKDVSNIPMITNGTRNDKMSSVVGRLIWEERPMQEIHELSHWVNRNRCVPPLKDSEVDMILNNMWKRETGK